MDGDEPSPASIPRLIRNHVETDADPHPRTPAEMWRSHVDRIHSLKVSGQRASRASRALRGRRAEEVRVWPTPRALSELVAGGSLSVQEALLVMVHRAGAGMEPRRRRARR